VLAKGRRWWQVSMVRVQGVKGEAGEDCFEGVEAGENDGVAVGC
jgi:hypothetical protein